MLYKDKNELRAYNVLKQNAWTDIINYTFLKVHKLSCNFVYKHCKVNIDMSPSKFFLLFNATCKNCNNSLNGWSGKTTKRMSTCNNNFDIIYIINIKNKDVKKRRTTYMEPYPEIDRLIEKKYTRSASNTLILNGNMCTPLKIEKKTNFWCITHVLLTQWQ